MRCHPGCLASVLVAALAAPSGAQGRPPTAAAPEYLYVWATAIDTTMAATVVGDTPGRPRRRGVFLAAIDLREGAPTRGAVAGAVLAADTAGRFAHHTEHALAGDGLLFANDFLAGRTYRFDLRTPGEPRLLGQFTTAGPLGFPHSFVKLANGHVLATYQRQASGHPPGGLAELQRDGVVVRWAFAAAPGVDSAVLQPYSLEVIPALDRVVSTSYSMTAKVGLHVQVWRLSDLTLLHTLALPLPLPLPLREAPLRTAHESQGGRPDTSLTDPAAHDEVHHLLPGEPRLLADGRTVMLGTFTCGLYLLTGLGGPAPRLAFVHAFPGRNCAVPVRVGRWWVQTVPALHALVALDVSDPAHPREVSHLALGDQVTPHWLAADASGRRLVTTSGGSLDPRVHLAVLDLATGALSPDPTTPTIDLSRVAVPGIGVVRAIPHGSVFGPGSRTVTTPH